MATTSPDNLRTPNPGDPYNLVPDLATLAGDVQTALTKRANSYIGTAAQMNAFTTAPNGTTWYNTTVNSLYLRQGGSWVLWSTPEVIGTPTAASGSTLHSHSVLTKDVNGFVSGWVGATRSVWSGATTLLTLPTGFRPSSTLGITMGMNGAGTPYAAMGQITSAGAVICQNVPTNGQTWAGGCSIAFQAA